MDIRDIARFSPAAQRQIVEKLGGGAQVATPTKYHNRKTERLMPNGKRHTFDSLKEARRYDELVLLQNAGKILGLKLQRQFTLQESYISAEGDRVRPIRYVADFTYERPTAPDRNGDVYWLPVVEDTKGIRTSDYKLKEKLMQEKFGISIREI